MSRKSSAVMAGILAGVLIFSVGFSGFIAYRYLHDNNSGTDDPGSSAQRRDDAEPPTDPGPFPETDPRLARFYDQDLEWDACGGNLDCARMTVPMDYAKPGGDTIELSVLRSRAYDRANRVGQLVVNPGGPGGSGLLTTMVAASAPTSTRTVAAVPGACLVTLASDSWPIR